MTAGLAKVAVEFTQIAVEDIWFISRYVAEKSGVNKPRQIHIGNVDLSKRASARKPARAAKKNKAKAKTKTKAKAKTKTKAKTKPSPKHRKSAVLASLPRARAAGAKRYMQ